MRQTFDKSVPLIEQRMRVAFAKQPGRKHGHRKGPTRSHEEKETAKRHAKLVVMKKRRHSALVSAYWNGLLDQYPK